MNFCLFYDKLLFILLVVLYRRLGLAYYSVEDTVKNYIEKYGDICVAIAKSQVRKHTSRTKTKYEFWCAVEQQLQNIKLSSKPKKRFVWEDDE